MQTGNNWTCDFMSLSMLPDTALIEIYSVLPYKDRLSTASTCSKCWRVFNEAQLWRRQNVDLASEPALAEAAKLVHFHGRHIRELIIDAFLSPDSRSPRMQIQMLLLVRFLKRLDSISLTTLRIRNFRLGLYWGFGAMRARLIKSIKSFMGKQVCLENVDLSQNGLELRSGLIVLQTSVKASAQSIKNINITDFFTGKSMAHVLYSSVFTKLPSLTDISTNYSYISNNFLDKLAQSNKSLKNLSIRVNSNDCNTHSIDSATWSNLRRTHQNLCVKFEFTGQHSCDVIQGILVAQIPLHSLDIWSAYRREDEFRVPHLLAYIAQTFHKTLVECTLNYNNIVMPFHDELEEVIRRCSGLRSFEVTAKMSTGFVANICQLRQEKQVVLEKFHVTCYRASMKTLCDLTKIREKYIAMIKKDNLDYSFQTDLVMND